MREPYRYAVGQVWRSRRGHRREIVDLELFLADEDGGEDVCDMAVRSSYRAPTHWVTADEMDAWVAKHAATLREPAASETAGE